MAGNGGKIKKFGGKDKIKRVKRKDVQAAKNSMQMGDVFWWYVDALNDGYRYIQSVGGTRSGKTYSALQLLYLKAANTPGLEIIIGALTVNILKKNLMKPFFAMIQGYDDRAYNRTDKTYTFPNGTVIYFMSADSEDKFVGLASDYVLLDEVNLYPEGDEITKQLAMRCRGALIFTMNPSRRVDFLAMLEWRDDNITMHSTYKNNPFLELTVVKEIEERAKNRDGRYMANAERAIYNNWRVMEDGEEFPEYEFKWRAWGLDFGFKNDPTALIEVVYHDKKLYLREHTYETKLTTAEISKRLLKIVKGELIMADNSEPRLIHELGAVKGINIVSAKKYRGSVLDGIRAVQNEEIIVDKNSKHLIMELEDYQWKKTSGTIMDIPEDANNHLMDALRYAALDRLTIGFGKYAYQ